jgi:nucleoside-diphosphate-sugar epimerase
MLGMRLIRPAPQGDESYRAGYSHRESRRQTPVSEGGVMARILIAGCGAVGTRLGGLLAADGHEVWGLRRQAGVLPAPIRPLQADLRDRASLGHLPEGLDYVFYSASAGRFDETAYRAAYVDGLRASGQQPRRVVFTSSTGVYGQTDGEWVDEDSPTEPPGFSGRCLLEGERLVLAGPYPATVVRLAGLYGPGPGRLIDRVRHGQAVCPSGPPRYTNRIHRDDAASALHHLVGVASPASIYVGCDDEPTELGTIYRWLATQLGVPEPRVGSAGEALRPQGGNKRCRNHRLRASGLVLRYPTFREGYGAILAADQE